eukprot:m.169088 g.169088  ORF g.169088 m.169088 type:complete len:122 (+) comp15325_c0_seq3:45-410(+)
MIGEPGIVFPEFKDASTWRSNSFAVLQNEIKKQIRVDGMHIENVLSYQRSTLDIFSNTALLARHNGLQAFPEWYWRILLRMVQAMEILMLPNGKPSQIGGCSLFCALILVDCKVTMRQQEV